jgi:hypothetical protein
MKRRKKMLKLTVNNKNIKESLKSNANGFSSKIEGYELSFLLDLEGAVKREYVTFQVDKTTFEKYKVGDEFPLSVVVPQS